VGRVKLLKVERDENKEKKKCSFLEFSEVKKILILTTWDKIFVLQNDKKMREQIKYECIMMFIEFHNSGKE